jgi:hypothetical protein
MAAHRGEHQAEHVALALGVMGLERDHEPRGVVEQRVHAERFGGLPDAQRWSVAYVAVP